MSTAPRVPRIPARGPITLHHDSTPRWHEVPALRWVVIVGASSLAVLLVRLFCALLEALA